MFYGLEIKNKFTFVCKFIKKKRVFQKKWKIYFVANMHPNKKSLIGILKRFYQAYFPNAYAILLSGSLIDKKQHQKSDIDLVIFTTDQDQCFNEDFDYEGFKIQTIVIVVQMLPTLLQQDYALGIGNQTGMIAKGWVVHDTQNYLLNLIQYCQQVYESGPPAKPLEETRLLQLDVVQLYQKIHTSSFEDNFFQVPDLAMKLATLNLHHHRWWASSRKFLFEQLKAINPKLQKDLFEATADFFRTNTTQRLIEVVKNNLNAFSDLKDLNSNNTGLSEVKGNELVLCLQVPNAVVQQAFLQLQAFLQTLCQNNNHVRFYIYRTFSGEYYLQEYDSLIAVLSGNKQILNGLLPIIPSLLQTSHYQLLAKIRYPANIDIRLGFGKNYSIVEQLFFEWSFFLSEKQNTLSTQKILFSIDIIVALGKAHFKDIKTFQLFLKYVFECWFPKTYDSGRAYGFAQIVEAKRNAKEIFTQNIAQQVPQLYPFVKTILDWKNKDKLILTTDFNIRFLEENKVKIPPFNSLGLHPIFRFLPKNTDINQFSFLKNTIERLLGILLIKESQKPYIIYLIQSLYEKT